MRKEIKSIGEDVKYLKKEVEDLFAAGVISKDQYDQNSLRIELQELRLKRLRSLRWLIIPLSITATTMFQLTYFLFDFENYRKFVFSNSHNIFFTYFLLFSVGLYALKKTYQMTYGILETGFALFSLWNATLLDSIKMLQISPWLSIAASSYLIVRGLTNYFEGFEKWRIREKAKTLQELEDSIGS